MVTMMNYKEFEQFSYNQHDVVCNQKYSKYNLPYSFHLKMVYNQFELFEHLIGSFSDKEKIVAGIAGHDLIEDARVTYNNIKDLIGEEVANIIYDCTEEKGMNREERHSVLFFRALSHNKLATFVKLCDVIANVKFGILENSSMVKKYKAEYPKFKDFLFIDEYKEMFDYLESLFNTIK